MKTFLVYNTSYFGDTILTEAFWFSYRIIRLPTLPDTCTVSMKSGPMTNGASIRDLPDGINFIKNIKTNMFLMPLLSFTAMSGAFYYPNF